MRLNRAVVVPSRYTHGGAKAAKINAEQELRRSVMACMLWEDEFYETGQRIADRINALIPQVEPQAVADMAHEARVNMKLRHAPLLLVREMARHATHKGLVAETLQKVIQRPDELSEFVAIYWKDKKQPLSAQVKRGLAAAFQKFDGYQLAKYNRDHAIRLRDVMFLVHPEPKGLEQTRIFAELASNTLKSPDTWEVALSAGKNKRDTFERLINDHKLGAMALLRNLRNMQQAGVDESIVKAAIRGMKTERVLPFRFITAARYVPRLEDVLEKAMFKCLEGHPKLPGKTVLVIDVSGSMQAALSAKSEVDRIDAAASLAMIAREVCEEVSIYATAGDDWRRVAATQPIPPRRGFALRDAIRDAKAKLGGGGIFLVQAMNDVHGEEKTADRIIVFTDEQDCDLKLNPAAANAFGTHNYLVNVASAQNGIGYGKWTHIDGWSEAIINYMLAAEGCAADEGELQD